MPTTYEPIATTTLAGNTTTKIDFSSIAQSWTDLRLVITGTTASDALSYIRLNDDSRTIYSITWLIGNGSAAASSSTTNVQQWATNNYAYGNAKPGFVSLDLFSYSSGSVNKTALMTLSADQNGTGAVEAAVCLFRSTSGISSISLFTSGSTAFNAGTTATLYGIKAA